jgi:FtsH-binding integral membrane protein
MYFGVMYMMTRRAPSNSAATVPTFIDSALNYTTANLALLAMGVFITYFCAIPMMGPFITFGISIALSFLISYLAKKQNTAENNNTLRLAVFGLFIWLGYALTPYILSFLFFIPHGPLLLIGAAITTAFITLTTAFYARYAIDTGQADKFILMRPLLMNLVLGLIVMGVLNVFLQMPLILLLEGLAGACVFTLFLLSDIIMIATLNEHCHAASPADKERLAILCGANIALDITNIFISLLEIAEALSNKSSRNSIGNSLTTLFMTLVGPLLMLGVVFGMNDAFTKKDPISVSHTTSPTNSQVLNEKKPSFIEWCFGCSTTPSPRPSR